MMAEIRKAALLLSSLPRPLATRLLDRMPAKKVAAIRAFIDPGGPSSTKERRQAIRDFLQFSAGGKARAGNPRRRLDPPGAAIPSFHFLAPLPPADIVRLLRDELPQTQAALLAQMPAHLAAEVLVLFSNERRYQVVRRLAKLGPISNAALADMADVMAQILSRRLPARPQDASRPGDVLDELLANSSGTVNRVLAEAINQCRASAEAEPKDHSG